ncbi:MAG TPA: site-2 protease family protein [Kineosporiaceae bacterium]|nr:site-2 protease family protein [Kineosporiaceae bacterium]
MTDVLGYVVGVAVLLVGVALSIALHELGHLVPAKRFGVKCTQYMIGFGPTVWSRRRGETEYGFKLIPLGGYVRMLGMFPPRDGRPARADTTGRWGLMIEQARTDAQRDISPEDGDRLFYQRSVPKRLVIMLGGPVMNLLIAVVLLTLLVTTFGIAQQATTRIADVSQCVLPADAPASRTCTAADPKAPAAAAGLQPGDVIVAYAGQPVTSWEQVRDRIRGNDGTPVPLTVERAGKRIDVQVKPVVEPRPVADADGNAVLDADGNPRLQKVGFLGVVPAIVTERQSITAVPAVVGKGLAQTAGVVLRIPQKMVGVAQAAFGDGKRDPNGPVSVVGVTRFAGEVGAAQGSAAQPITFADKIAFWLGLVASLNLALFVFNLVPLLPLDGGHVAGALWEGLRRRVARLLHRPDPGPVDVARALPLAYGVASVLLGMSVLLIYADIVNPVRIG